MNATLLAICLSDNIAIAMLTGRVTREQAATALRCTPAVLDEIIANAADCGAADVRELAHATIPEIMRQMAIGYGVEALEDWTAIGRLS